MIIIKGVGNNGRGGAIARGMMKAAAASKSPIIKGMGNIECGWAMKHVIVESDAEEDLDKTISHKSAHANLANATSYLNDNNESSEASSSADIEQEQTDTNLSGEEDLLNIETILDVPVIREPPRSSQLRSIETKWSSIPTHVHSRSSSVVDSVPQSSKYEADCASGEDSNQYPLLDQGTGKKTLKAPATKGRSQPKVKDHKLKHENTPCLHKDWPEHASVDIICIETVNILKVNSWPEFQCRDTFRQEFLSAAVKHNSGVDRIVDIELQLKQDPDFSARLGNMVLDCLPLVRSPVKTSAASQIAAYELGIGKRCQQRINSLFDDSGLYIFPGEWSSVNQWVPKADEPFLNVAILEALKTSFFHALSSVGHEAVIKYNNEIDNLDKPELPIAMVALGATAVYAALLEWVEGIKTSRSFDGNVFAIIYESHVETLEGMREDHLRAFHVIMHELY
ncbi:hypothetical protein BDQ17DRAFT_1431380 [Cyathus striatus]|nr:hypothetical protein BDQ17DRAFT_1431380 [Cyathus striatus]